jgi:hypothetical protein
MNSYSHEDQVLDSPNGASSRQMEAKNKKEKDEQIA